MPEEARRRPYSKPKPQPARASLCYGFALHPDEPEDVLFTGQIWMYDLFSLQGRLIGAMFTLRYAHLPIDAVAWTLLPTAPERSWTVAERENGRWHLARYWETRRGYFYEGAERHAPALPERAIPVGRNRTKRQRIELASASEFKQYTGAFPAWIQSIIPRQAGRGTY